MVRLKALYRSWAIPCAGQQAHAPRRRAEWLGEIAEAGVRRRAEFYYQQFDGLLLLHQQVRHALLAERKNTTLRSCCDQSLRLGPFGPYWLALIQTPHRFRTKRATVEL